MERNYKDRKQKFYLQQPSARNYSNDPKTVQKISCGMASQWATAGKGANFRHTQPHGSNIRMWSDRSHKGL